MSNLLLLLVAAAALPPCVIPLFIARPRARYSRLFFVLYGIGVHFLLSLPAGLVQAFYYVEHVQGKSFLLRMALPFLAAPFNMGGAVMRLLYELIVGPPAAARSGVASGAISHFHIYLPLLVLLVIGAAQVFARRFEKSRSFADRVVVGIMAVLFVNSMLNVAWPWWGK